MNRKYWLLIVLLLLVSCKNKIERDAFGGLKLGIAFSEERKIIDNSFEKLPNGSYGKKIYLGDKSFYAISFLRYNIDSVVVSVESIMYKNKEDAENAKIIYINNRDSYILDDVTISTSLLVDKREKEEIFKMNYDALVSKYGFPNCEPKADSSTVFYTWKKENVVITLIEHHIEYDNFYNGAVQLRYKYEYGFYSENKLDKYPSETDNF